MPSKRDGNRPDHVGLSAERPASQAAEVEAPLVAVPCGVDRRVRPQDGLGDGVLVCVDELG